MIAHARFRVGVDIGDTFTDIVLLDAEGRIHTFEEDRRFFNKTAPAVL
jgi:hypothetical protein